MATLENSMAFRHSSKVLASCSISDFDARDFIAQVIIDHTRSFLFQLAVLPYPLQTQLELSPPRYSDASSDLLPKLVHFPSCVN